MKTAPLAMVLLMSCASNPQSQKADVTPASGESARSEAASDLDAAPAPTISDSAPAAATPMSPSRVNVVPSVSPDKPLADAIGSSPDNVPKSFEATPATAGDLAKGVEVNDPSGQSVGTIDSVTDAGVVLTVGQGKVQVPLNSIGKNEKGLVIGLTRAEIEADANKAPKK